MGNGEGFSVASGRDGDAVVITVQGDLDLATAPQLRDACDAALESDPDTIRLDLAGLTFLDSSGISVLVKTHQDAEAAGAELVLHRVDDRTNRVLEVAGLADFFEHSDQPAR